jgi:hypothetical protein
LLDHLLRRETFFKANPFWENGSCSLKCRHALYEIRTCDGSDDNGGCHRYHERKNLQRRIEACWRDEWTEEVKEEAAAKSVLAPQESH